MRFLAALLVVIGLAPAARALDVAGLAIAVGGLNTANLLTNTGNNRTELASATSITLAPSGPVPDTTGSTIAFATRYASLLAVDREGPAGGSTSNTLVSDYTVTFTVLNPLSRPYQVDIDTSRLGALTAVTDDAGNGTQTLGAVTGTIDSIAAGELAMAAIGPFVETATNLSPFSQLGTTLTITDNAASRTYVLGFSWTSTATSDNDEAAIRMGIAGSLSTTLADDYPGQGGRIAGNDGHFVNVNVTVLPEPHTGALVSFGLVGLGIRRRRITRSRVARAA